MVAEEMFDSTTRSAGDLAGVFEFDGEVGYFYLYECSAAQGQRVLGAIKVVSGVPDFDASDVAVRWNDAESMVGLFIRGEGWAVFDGTSNVAFGGVYQRTLEAPIPAAILATFNTRTS